MLSADDYSLLLSTVRTASAEMWIDLSEYLATHYLPNWYPLIRDLTPETHFFAIDSKFFSVDIIERKDGHKRVVEIGDGQVSGLVGWTIDRLATLWIEQ